MHIRALREMALRFDSRIEIPLRKICVQEQKPTDKETKSYFSPTLWSCLHFASVAPITAAIFSSQYSCCFRK